jgi:hypothetical protein
MFCMSLLQTFFIYSRSLFTGRRRHFPVLLIYYPATILAKHEVSVARIPIIQAMKFTIYMQLTLYPNQTTWTCLQGFMLPSPDLINRPLTDSETAVDSRNILGHNYLVESTRYYSMISHRASWSCPFIWAKYIPARGEILPRILYYFYIFLRLHSHEPGWSNWLAQLLLEQVDILHWESHTLKVMSWPTSSLD